MTSKLNGSIGLTKKRSKEFRPLTSRKSKSSEFRSKKKMPKSENCAKNKTK